MRAGTASGIVLLILGSACGRDGVDRRPNADVTDSASIRVLTYADLDAPAASISVDTVPLWRVGWDPEGRVFERIEDVTVLRDGRVAVLDSRATQEIVLLDSEGSIVEVLGGHGKGPGEFTGISRVTSIETGLIVQDYMEARVTVYNGTEVTGTYSLPFLDHKAILGTSGGSFVFGPPLTVTMGRTHPDPWLRVAATISAPPFESEDTIAVLDWDQSLNFNGRDPWAASGVAAFDGGRVIYGRGDRPELTWYDLDGTPAQIVRWESPPEPVTDSAYAEFEEGYLERARGGMSPQAARGLLEQMALQHQGVRPYFDQLFVDEDGTVWLGAYLRFDQRTEEYERPFHLFSRDGELLGTVVLPGELRVRDVTKSMVVGYELGPFDEPAAVAYPIVRRPGDGDGEQP